MLGVTAEDSIILEEDAKDFDATSKLLPVAKSAKRRPEKLKPDRRTVRRAGMARTDLRGLSTPGSFLVKERDQSESVELIVDG